MAEVVPRAPCPHRIGHLRNGVWAPDGNEQMVRFTDPWNGSPDLRRRASECISDVSSFDWRCGTAADKMIDRRCLHCGEEGDNLGRSESDP